MNRGTHLLSRSDTVQDQSTPGAAKKPPQLDQVKLSHPIVVSKRKIHVNNDSSALERYENWVNVEDEYRLEGEDAEDPHESQVIISAYGNFEGDLEEERPTGEDPPKPQNTDIFVEANQSPAYAPSPNTRNILQSHISNQYNSNIF